MRLRLLALCFCLLLLGGCGTAGEIRPADSLEAEDPGSPEDLFVFMPGSYMFCSGAGGWSTGLALEEDGSFTGVFHDSDMGAADPERFPGGTIYICSFSGKFTQPEKVDETTYTVRLESLELDYPADESEEIVDGCLYIYSGPYGLENAEELRIYLPGTPVEGLPEGVLQAARGPYDWEETEEGTLGLCVIYNVEEGLGFVECPRVTEE